MDLGQANVRKQLPQYTKWVKKYFPDSKITEAKGYNLLMEKIKKNLHYLDAMGDYEMVQKVGLELVQNLDLLDGFVFGYLVCEVGDFDKVYEVYENTREERK